MKVVALTTSFPQHATDERSVFVKRLYDAIHEAGVDLTVVTPHPYDGSSAYEIRALACKYAAFGDAGLLRTVKAQPWTGLSLLRAAANFRAILAEVKPDITHANWTLCGAVAATSPFPSVVTLRGSDVHLLKAPLMSTVVGAMLRKAAVLTAVGASLAEVASHALGRSIVVIENGTELAAAEPLRIPNPCFVAIGTVSAIKGTLNLVRAFALFARSESTYHLVIAGRLSDTRYADAVRAEIAHHGVELRVHLIGAISPGQVTTLLRESQAFCGFSVSEGRPNAVLEAQSMGVPCVLSRISPHEELVTSNDILVAADEVSAAAAALKAVSAHARQAGRELPSWSVCAARYIELFRTIAAGQRGSDY